MLPVAEAMMKEMIAAREELFPGIKYKVLEWRGLFDQSTLEAGEIIFRDCKITEENSWRGTTYQILNGRQKIRVQIHSIPQTLGSDWRNAWMNCNTCYKDRCRHQVAALLAYEAEHGPAIAWESEYNYRQRMENIRLKEQYAQRKKEDQEAGLDPVPALSAFRGMKLTEPVIYDLEKALENHTTTPAAIRRMKAVQEGISSYPKKIEIEEDGRGNERIAFDHAYGDDILHGRVTGFLTPVALHINCYVERRTPYGFQREEEICGSGQPGDAPAVPLNEFELAEIALLWEAVNKRAREDVTDRSAELFFQGIRAQREEKVPKIAPQAELQPEKRECIELLPRIQIYDGEPMLSFRVGVTGGRMYVVKDCYALLNALSKQEKLPLGKTEALDFGKQAFRQESLSLLDFMMRHKAQSFGGMYQVQLKGSAIDNFYDMGQGAQCDYLDKTNNIKSDHVKVGHTDIRFTLTADRLADARGRFIGIVVSGMVPVLVKGNAYRYIVNPQALSRISPEEQRVIAPFLKVADDSGYFRFQVGTDRLQEFYYRVLPGLLENPFVQFEDHCEAESTALLPPEPQFQFLLDLEEKRLSLKCLVRYGDREVPLMGELRNQGDYRDIEQENTVISVIRKWLPYEKNNLFAAEVTDDALYDFLTVGVPTLEFYGLVKGTAAFRTRKVTQPPQVRLGIAVEGGGLMDLTVSSQELSPKELLALYDSYTKKKRYYRLKSGDFIDLTQSEDLAELDTFLKQLEIAPREAIGRKFQIPLYRALYLDRMLEDHNQLATTRDRTYRALIRNFKTVRDAEYEVPPVLENVLRPYQTYGYKWLRTLENAGFGGILADEMGLGKTVQMISVFQADHEGETSHLPSLVVCPASLVYNWQEEIQRFAPELRAIPVTGTSGVRAGILQQAGEADVLITSYDLLKRDILHYEEISFRHCVLDEAQFIKNARSAAAKTVKMIRAEHRFALTGTPIENRLLELWSVFDFLMPGFLYGQAEFEKRFELPIARQRDEKATEKLVTMTAPFILRRKKAEVLQDLPEKLEEIRYARLAGQQQKLYDAQVVRMKQMLSGGELAGEEKIKIFAELTRIRQICCDPSLLMENYSGESAKREACLELIQSAMEGGHRMLIFSQFVTMLELLEKDLLEHGIPYYKIVGATSKEKRISMVRAFNEGDVPVFLISLKAGGTGLNLTGADVVIHYDPWWNIAAQNQATDRAHRIGQTKRVTVFKLILKGTIEERIVALQDAKRDLAETILEGERESILSLSNEELLSLLEG